MLQPEECARLSRAMFEDVLSTLAAASCIDCIVVLTNDDSIAAAAEDLGHTVIRDPHEEELCRGLNSAAREIAAGGADELLVLPGDLPTLTTTDIEQLLQRHAGGLSLCPAIRDGGTNALVCTPPDAIEFQFGKNSAERHLQTAKDHGLATRRMAIPAFFRDIDIPDDLVWLSSQPDTTHTVRFLRQAGIFARLGPGAAGATA